MAEFDKQILKSSIDYQENCMSQKLSHEVQRERERAGAKTVGECAETARGGAETVGELMLPIYREISVWTSAFDKGAEAVECVHRSLWMISMSK